MALRWTQTEDRELARLRRAAAPDAAIAAALGRSTAAVMGRRQELGLCGSVGESNAKHKHLRKAAMTYFVTHSWKETAKHFGLTTNEFKSLMTSGYRDPALLHLRKDTRRHDAWTFAETMTLLRASGLQPRSWIAKRLSRGTKEAVKEQLARLGTGTRHINGIPLSWVHELVGLDIEIGFKVKAGPKGRGCDGRPILVPWVVLDWLMKRLPFLEVPGHLVEAFGAMAHFQKLVHGTRGVDDTMAAIQYILSEE